MEGIVFQFNDKRNFYHIEQGNPIFLWMIKVQLEQAAHSVWYNVQYWLLFLASSVTFASSGGFDGITTFKDHVITFWLTNAFNKLLHRKIALLPPPYKNVMIYIPNKHCFVRQQGETESRYKLYPKSQYVRNLESLISMSIFFTNFCKIFQLQQCLFFIG